MFAICCTVDGVLSNLFGSFPGPYYMRVIRTPCPNSMCLNWKGEVWVVVVIASPSGALAQVKKRTLGSKRGNARITLNRLLDHLSFG